MILYNGTVKAVTTLSPVCHKNSVLVIHTVVAFLKRSLNLTTNLFDDGFFLGVHYLSETVLRLNLLSLINNHEGNPQ